MSEEREVEKVGTDEFEAHKLTTPEKVNDPNEIEKVGSDSSSDDDFEGHKLTVTEKVIDKATDL